MHPPRLVRLGGVDGDGDGHVSVEWCSQRRHDGLATSLLFSLNVHYGTTVLCDCQVAVTAHGTSRSTTLRSYCLGRQNDSRQWRVEGSRESLPTTAAGLVTGNVFVRVP